MHVSHNFLWPKRIYILFYTGRCVPFGIIFCCNLADCVLLWKERNFSFRCKTVEFNY